MRQKANTTQEKIQAVIRLVYALALQRDASPEEVKAWTKTVSAKPTASRLATAINEIASSNEARDSRAPALVEAAIRRTYASALHRVPSAEEVKAWANTVGARPTASRLANVINDIATSDEATSWERRETTLWKLSNGAFVQLAYETILQRGALPQEIAFYDYALDREGLTREDLLIQLFQEHITSLPDQSDNSANPPTILGTNTFMTLQDWQERADRINKERRRGRSREKTYSHFSLTNNANILVTAIASIYKGAPFISRFMENISSQSIFKDRCELIIVDANSPENEFEVVRPYLDRFPNVQYLRLPHRIGIYEAWNLAISGAQGKYITNTNVDDLRRRTPLSSRQLLWTTWNSSMWCIRMCTIRLMQL